MMLEAHLNTRALAGAFAENIKSGFLGDKKEEINASKKRLSNPVPQIDGKKCYTENCSWHKGTTKESETKPNQKKHVKTKDRGNVIYKDDRCSVVKYKNGK